MTSFLIRSRLESIFRVITKDCTKNITKNSFHHNLRKLLLISPCNVSSSSLSLAQKSTRPAKFSWCKWCCIHNWRCVRAKDWIPARGNTVYCAYYSILFRGAVFFSGHGVQMPQPPSSHETGSFRGRRNKRCHANFPWAESCYYSRTCWRMPAGSLFVLHVFFISFS